jgi:hypothetical protein
MPTTGHTAPGRDTEDDLDATQEGSAALRMKIGGMSCSFWVKPAGVVYEVDPSMGRVGQAVMAWSSGSVTSSAGSASTAWERARTSSPR